MNCPPICKSSDYVPPKSDPKDDLPVYLIRLESGDVVYPSVNLYADFIDSCKKYKVIGDEGKLTQYVVSENLDYVLLKRTEEVNENRPEDNFQLGQIFFEKGHYSQALNQFRNAILRYDDPRAKYQIAVMLFDGLLDPAETAQYENPQKAAFCMMQGLLTLNRGVGAPLGNAEIVDSAAFNLYLACLHGWGVEASDKEALRYLEMAGTYGDTRVSVMAQTTLGYYYSSRGHMDLKKAFYWHSEACQNGSVDSQAVIGIFHMFGLGGTRKDWYTALTCLRSASERGCTYATGLLSFLYLRRGFYTLASRTAYSLVSNVELRNAVLLAAAQNNLVSSSEPAGGKAATGSLNASTSAGGGASKRDDGLVDSGRLGFVRRGLAVACFVYATCLDRGLGIQQDKGIAGAMYSRCILIDPTTTSRLHALALRQEL